MTARLIRLVHVGARELGLDDDTRRDLQLTVTGKASLAAMTEGEIGRVVDALKARGFRPSAGPAGGKGGTKGMRRPAAPRGDLRFAHVLWSKLARAGAVDQAGAAGLNAFVRARFGAAWGAEPIDVDTLRDGRKIATLLEALKAMCRRAGVEV